MKVFAFIAMLAISAPSAVLAQDEAPKKEKKERLICKQNPAKTGSRMGSGRTCRTATQWAELSRNGSALQEDADKLEMMSEKVSTGDVGGLSPR